MRKIIARYPGVFFFLSILLVYIAAGKMAGSFERRAVPHDFLYRYVPIAWNILARGDFLLGDRAPSPPLYPLALALGLGASSPWNIDPTTLARVFNLAAAMMLALVFCILARGSFGPDLGLLAAVILPTYPFVIYAAFLPGPEVLYLLSLMISILAVLRVLKRWEQGHVFLAGLASAVPMLVKPMAIFLPLFHLAVLLVQWRKNGFSMMPLIQMSALFIMGAMLCLIPWETYLYVRTGKLIPVADKAGSAIYDGWTFGLKVGAGHDRLSLPDDVVAFMRRVESESERFGPTWSIIAAVKKAAGERPWAFFKLIVIKAIRCWYGTDEMWHEGKIIAIQIFYLILCLIGTFVWFRKGRPGGWLMAMLALILLYHWAAAMAVLSILRYMLPASFLMAALASFAFSAVRKRIS